VMALMGGLTRERNRMSCRLSRLFMMYALSYMPALEMDVRDSRLSLYPLRHDSLREDPSWRAMYEVVSRKKEKSVGSMSFRHY